MSCVNLPPTPTNSMRHAISGGQIFSVPSVLEVGQAALAAVPLAPRLCAQSEFHHRRSGALRASLSDVQQRTAAYGHIRQHLSRTGGNPPLVKSDTKRGLSSYVARVNPVRGLAALDCIP